MGFIFRGALAKVISSLFIEASKACWSEMRAFADAPSKNTAVNLKLNRPSHSS